MIEKEKQRVLEEREKEKTEFQKINTQEKNGNKKEKSLSKIKLYKNFGKILSMAAVVIIVFTLGINLKTAPNDDENANLIMIKSIKPTNMESGILANNSEFIIEVEGENLNTDVIQKSIYVEPALDYSIEKTLNKSEYKLTFKQNIPDNTLLKLQYVKNQITEDSWAYQTSNKLSVTSTYPNDEEAQVSEKTVIEVEFSYANIENFEKNVSITPKTEGKWKHYGNIWRFTPEKKLNKDTEYRVTIKAGVSSGEQKLENDYKFKFTVGETHEINYLHTSIDKIIILNCLGTNFFFSDCYETK